MLAQAPWRERQSSARIAAFAVELCGHPVVEAADAEGAFAQLKAHLDRSNSALRGATIAELEAMYQRYDRHGARVWQLLSAWRIEPLDDTVDLFEASEPGRWPRPLAPLWRRNVAALRVHAVPGDHRSMLASPHARILAEAMSRVAACAKL